MIRFFDPGRAYRAIKPEIDEEMQRVLNAGDLILRDDVDRFERNLAAYVGTKYAVAVASGTDALILSLRGAGIGQGDKVLAPSYTFRATIEAIYHVGATPVLYDSLSTMPSLDLEGVVAWIPAYIAGEVTTIDDHFRFAQKHGWIVIEDACQAIGAAPVRGLASCYSFYPAKILGCYGDGGAVATNDKLLYDWLRKARNHFKDDWAPIGWNSRLDNIQAAVLNVKIKYLPQAIKRRKEIAEMYDFYLKGVGKPTQRMVYQDYIISHKNRDGLREFLKSRGIETMDNGYPFPKISPKGPLTLRYESESLRLPIYPELTDEEVREVIDGVNAYA